MELHVVDEEVEEELQEEVEEEEWKLILVQLEQVPTKKRPSVMTKAHILEMILPSTIYTQIIVSISVYWRNHEINFVHYHLVWLILFLMEIKTTNTHAVVYFYMKWNILIQIKNKDISVEHCIIPFIVCRILVKIIVS